MSAAAVVMAGSSLRTIRLSGVLGKRFGRVHRLAVSSAAEAARALCVMVPGFEQFLTESREKHNLTYAVFLGERNIGREELRNPVHAHEEIRFSPRIIGAKNGGAIMTVLGAVLVVVGIFLIWTPFGAPLIAAGAAMMVGGIVMMLAPKPKDPSAEDDADKKTSYAFNGPVNTQAQGNPVPVLLGGPMTVGSAVVSAGINVEQNSYVPDPAVAAGGFSTSVSAPWRLNNPKYIAPNAT